MDVWPRRTPPWAEVIPETPKEGNILRRKWAIPPWGKPGGRRSPLYIDRVPRVGYVPTHV